MSSLIPKFKEIKGFVFDIDGVLTKGDVLVTEEGQQLRTVNIKDGYALQHAVKQNYSIVYQVLVVFLVYFLVLV